MPPRRPERIARGGRFDRRPDAASERTSTPNGLEPIDGVIDYLRPNFMEVRSADALYCFFGRNAFGGPVAMSIHMFADGVDPEQIKQSWQQALNTALA